jgi:hypothetical protein
MDQKETLKEQQNDDDNFRVVATLDSVTYWRDFIRNLLPETSRGIVIFFQNACGGTFTYQIL